MSRRRLSDMIWWPDRRGHTGSSIAGVTQPVERIPLQWLLVTGALASAPLVVHLPLWVSALFAAFTVWRYVIERFQLGRPARMIRYALLGLILFAIYTEYRTVLGRDPGMAMLVALLGLKLLELRSQRDAILTLFLFYVVLLGSFLYAQTLIVALWVFVTIWISLGALIRLQQPLPPRALLRLAGGLLLKAVPLLLILYMFFPRVTGSLWELPGDNASAVTGIGDEMRPGSVRNISESNDIALRIDFFDGALPAPRELYWRGIVLWENDGKVWRRGTRSINSDATLQPESPPVRYRITQEPSNKRWLFALDMPANAPEATRLRPDFTLVRFDPINERISYTLTSYTKYRTESLSLSERVAALALPPISERVQAFADELRAQHAEPAERVRAMLLYLRRENFVYTLSPPMLQDDPVDQFLFDTRRGFCEHYAGAFATVMRAAGVPARVVIGYQGGEINPTGNYLMVRQADAHAWAEVWLPNRGWVRVDPTAAVAPERVELGANAIRRLEERGLVPGSVGSDALARALELPWLDRAWQRTRLYWDYANLAWYRWVIDYRKERQERFWESLGLENIDWRHIVVIVGGSCLVVLFIYAAWSRRRPSPDPAQRIYLRFCRKLARVGLPRAAHEGPLAFAKRVAKRRPDLAPGVEKIMRAYVEVRYGEDGDIQKLELAVRRFRPRRAQRAVNAEP